MEKKGKKKNLYRILRSRRLKIRLKMMFNYRIFPKWSSSTRGGHLRITPYWHPIETSKEEAAANQRKNRYKESSSFLKIKTGRPYFTPPPAIREYT
jgi:hypothetical protein